MQIYWYHIFFLVSIIISCSVPQECIFIGPRFECLRSHSLHLAASPCIVCRCWLVSCSLSSAFQISCPLEHNIEGFNFFPVVVVCLFVLPCSAEVGCIHSRTKSPQKALLDQVQAQEVNMGVFRGFFCVLYATGLHVKWFCMQNHACLEEEYCSKRLEIGAANTNHFAGGHCCLRGHVGYARSVPQ